MKQRALAHLAAVFRVARYRVSYRGEVRARLVRAARHELRLDDAPAPAYGDSPVKRERALPAFVGAHCVRARVLEQRQVDFPFLGRGALDDGPIDFSDFAFAHELGEGPLRAARERDYHRARCVSVEALHRRGTVVVSLPAKFRERPRDERVAAALVGLGQKASGLVDYPGEIVFVESFERLRSRQLTRGRGGLLRAVLPRHGEPLPLGEAGFALRAFPVEAHLAGAYRLHYRAERHAGPERPQHAVHPAPVVVGGDYELARHFIFSRNGAASSCSTQRWAGRR